MYPTNLSISQSLCSACCILHVGGNSLELSLVVGDAFRSAVLCRTLQHHDVDRPGGVASARLDPALPVPSEPRLDVGDGQRTEGK